MDFAGRRKKAKADGNQMEWSHLNKDITKTVEEDKGSFYQECGRGQEIIYRRKVWEIEKFKGNSKKMYQTVKEMTNKWMRGTDVMNDEDGNTLTEIEEIKRGGWNTTQD